MGTSANENIAIAISTTADLSGSRATRADMTALGKEATVAAQQLTAAGTATSAAQNGLAVAARAATTETGALKVSQDQMREALIQTGGDLEKAAALLAGVAKEEVKAAAAAETAAVSTDKLTAANERSIRQMGLAEVAAYKEDAARRKSLATVEKVPGSARTAANSLGILSQAALTGGGSIAGMAAAAGGMATGLATLTTSAKVAASAAGIGALITVAVALVEAYRAATKEADGFAKSTQNFGGLKPGQLKIQEDAARREAQAISDQIQATSTLDPLNKRKGLLEQMRTVEDRINLIYSTRLQAEQALRKEEELRHIELAQSARDEIASNRLTLQLELDRMGHKKNDYQLSLEANQNERAQHAAQIREEFRHRDANGQIVALTAEEVRLRDTLLDQNNKLADAKGRELRAEYEIALNTAKAAQLASSDDPRSAFRGRLEQIEIEKRAEIQKLGDVETATLNAEQKKRALYLETSALASRSFVSLAAESLRTINTQIQAHASLAKIVTAAAITPIVKELEALGTSEATKAIAHFADFDLVGGGLHSAASIAAFAAAAKVSSQGGLGSSGGGGGGSSGAGSGGGSGSAFSDRGQAASSGPVVVNLYTTDPFNRENIMIASYQLQRSGITKRPIYLPPTNGLNMAPA